MSGMRLIAHRGCAGQYPENTVSAVRQSAPHVDYVELDVRRCGSGELVVFHDEELDRKTAATGPVAATDRATLRGLTIGDTGEGIPSLREALDAIPDGVGVELDLKVDGVAAEAVRLASAAGVETLVLSGDPEITAGAASSVDVPVGYILDAPALEEGLDRAVGMGCSFVYANYEYCADAAFVERVHDAGLAVNAGTIRSAEAAAEYLEPLREAGVDYLSVDRWDFL